MAHSSVFRRAAAEAEAGKSSIFVVVVEIDEFPFTDEIVIWASEFRRRRRFLPEIFCFCCFLTSHKKSDTGKKLEGNFGYTENCANDFITFVSKGTILSH